MDDITKRFFYQMTLEDLAKEVASPDYFDVFCGEMNEYAQSFSDAFGFDIRENHNEIASKVYILAQAFGNIDDRKNNENEYLGFTLDKSVEPCTEEQSKLAIRLALYRQTIAFTSGYIPSYINNMEKKENLHALYKNAMQEIDCDNNSIFEKIKIVYAKMQEEYQTKHFSQEQQKYSEKSR